ncbi:MAG: DUF4249 domain-containing protein [Cytophagales bacterium]|nr:MAG: DUF4249 domain-containing protein [Cytophagales bacterium]TAF59909.1 MAG: DUF4249 domain-containing protein [Cytophagales bacterium]
MQSVTPKIKVHFVVVFSLLLSLLGCESTVTNVEIPEVESKLVITSFISPEEDSITAELYESRPIFDPNSTANERQPISNATVTLSNGIESVNLVYDRTLERYQISAAEFKIEGGRTYSITASTPDGRKVKATCSVPSGLVAVPSLKMDSSFNSRDQFMRYRLKFSWLDLPEKGNLYRVAAARYGLDEDSGGLIRYVQSIAIEDGLPYLDDETNNGNPFSRIVVEDRTRGERPVTIEFLILHTDSHYYRYHFGLFNYTSGNPFAEPTLVYTNVENGLGCFGAYRLTKARKEFR